MVGKKYRDRLTAAETGMYDLMLKTSTMLEQLARESSDDILPDDSKVTNVAEYLHDVVTYAFTLGVQFAVQRQQEVARDIAKKMGLVEQN